MPQTPTPPRRWASLDAAASHLNCSPRTLRRMIARGEITGYRVGARMLRVDLEELDALAQPIPAADAFGRGAA